MPPTSLTLHQLSDADADAALAKLPPVPDNVMVLLRSLQAQVSDLNDRVTVLEP